MMNMAVYEMLPSPADVLRPFSVIKRSKMKLTQSQRKWPEERIPVDLEPIPGFNLRAQVVGQGGAYVKHIQQRTRCKVQIKGRGSGFIEHNTGRESDEPMYLHVAYVSHSLLINLHLTDYLQWTRPQRCQDRKRALR